MSRDERGAVERAERLDRYWDEVILGAPDRLPAAGPDPASAEVVRRLSAFPGAPGAEEARAQVWQRLLEQDPSLAQEVGRTSLHEANQRLTTPNGRIPLAEKSPSPTRLTTARRFWPLLEFAAAAALILGLLGLLGDYLTEPRVLPRIAALWRDPVAPAVPMARGGPARTGEMPGPAPEGEPHERWRVPPPAERGCDCSGFYPSPVLANGLVYLGYPDGRLVALDAGSGAERWQFKTGGAVAGAPAVVDGTVFVGSSDGNVYALDAESGAERWRSSIGVVWSAAAVAKGLVYVTTGQANAAPAVTDGTVYVGDGFGSVLYALDATTGEQRWSSGPLQQGLSAFDAVTGAERWHVTTERQVNAPPAVTDGRIYVSDVDRRLYALDAASGTQLWSTRVGEDPDTRAAGSSIWTPGPAPAVRDGTVYAAGWDGTLLALDAATGAERWRSELAFGTVSSPVVAGDAVLIGGMDGTVSALDAATGELLWAYALGDAIGASLAVADEIVYVPTADGTFVALGT